MAIPKFFQTKPASELKPGDWLGVMACLGVLVGMAFAMLAAGLVQGRVVLGWVTPNEPTLVTSVLSLSISALSIVFVAWLIHRQMAEATVWLTVVGQKQQDAG